METKGEAKTEAAAGRKKGEGEGKEEIKNGIWREGMGRSEII